MIKSLDIVTQFPPYIQARLVFASGMAEYLMGQTHKELYDKIVDRIIDHAYLNQDVFGNIHGMVGSTKPANVLPDIDIEEVIGTDGNIEEWIDDGGKAYSEDHRVRCTTIGEAGHWNCGWCDEHKCPRHECMCSVYRRGNTLMHVPMNIGRPRSS